MNRELSNYDRSDISMVAGSPSTQRCPERIYICYFEHYLTKGAKEKAHTCIYLVLKCTYVYRYL